MKKTFLLLAAICSFAACHHKPKDGSSDQLTSGFIRIASSNEFENLIEDEINSFSGHYDSAYVIPIYRTEAEAIRLLVDDSVRLTTATRDLTDRERYEMSLRNMVPRRSLIAFDAVALITGRENPDSIISVHTLKKILTGEITDWSQINAANAGGTIRVVFDNQQSGIFRYIVDSLLNKQTEKINPNLYELGTTDAVVKTVSERSDAIGLIALNHISDDNRTACKNILKKTRLMRVSQAEPATLDNSTLPYAGDIRAEQYPLWRSVYIIVSDPKSGLATGFGVFLANQVGQKVIQTCGLLPITDAHNIRVEITDELPQ